MVELAEKLPAQRGRSLLGSPPHDLILRVRGGQHSGYVVRLSELKCTIGSHERCTFRVRAAGVQPWHCLVFRGSQATFVRRLDENTRLNGRTFDLAKLSAGDRLTVGPVELEVIDEQVARRRPSPSSTAALPRHWHDPSASVRAAAEQAGRQASQLKDALAKTRHAATRRVRQLAEQLRSARDQIRSLHEETERSHHESAAEQEAVARQQELLAGQFEQRKSELEAELEQRTHQLEARTAELLQQEQEFATRRAATEQEFDARQRELNEQRDQIRIEQSRAQQEISEARHGLHSSSEQRDSQQQQLEQARADWEQQRRSEQERLLEQAELLKQRRADLAASEAEIEAARDELDNLRAELEQLRTTTSKIQPPPPDDVEPVLPADGPVALTSGDETAQVVEATLRSLIGQPAPFADTVPERESDTATAREEIGGASATDDGPGEQRNPTNETVAAGLARMGSTLDWNGQADASTSPAIATERTADPAPAPLQAAAETQPQPATPDQPAEPADGHGNQDESVEDYMARLMQRLRGGEAANQDPVPSTLAGSTPEVATEAPVPEPAAETQPTPDVVEPSAPVEEPIEPSEYKPRNQAPERGAGLDALRDLANSSARSAISTHKVKTDGKAAIGKAIAAGLALLGAVAFFCWQGYNGTVGLAGTGIALVVAMIWGLQAVVLTWRAQYARRITKRIGVEQARASDDRVDVSETVKQL